MRVLVTGGAGYIGSETCRELARAGHAPVVLDDLSRGHRAACAEFDLVRGDVRSPEDLSRAFARGPFDAVIHFAGLALVPESIERPALYWEVNAVGGLRLLGAAIAAGVRRFVFSSTCAVYGIPERAPIPEDHPRAPFTPYGRSKLAFEHALDDFARATGISATSLRYFNAAGASEGGAHGEDHAPETHLIPRVLAAARAGDSVPVFGCDYPTRDGTAERDYIHVADLATVHRLAIEREVGPGHSALNVGTGRGATVREVVAAARRVTGRAIPEAEMPRRQGDPPCLVADAGRAKALLGFEPARSALQEIIEDAWRWHRDHPRGYAEEGS